MKRAVATAMAVLSLGFILGACSGSNEDGQGTTLNRGLSGEPDSFDQHANKSTQGHRVLIDLFEGLLRYSADGKIEGAVAKNWSVSDDGLTYRFVLRPEARWSNGDKLTARDFVYSFQRLVNPETAAFYAQFVSVIENVNEIVKGDADVTTLGVSAEDDYTLVIRLNQPTPYFPQLLTHPSTAPVHAASISEHGDKFTRPGNLISNGAYVLEEFVHGHAITLKKNNLYREADSVKIDRVRYVNLVSEESMYNQYRAGELHITTTVPTSKFEQAQEERPDELKIAPMLGVYYYGFNMTKEPFAGNKQLRAALSMAVDRDILVSAVKRRGELPAYSWVPPGIEGYEQAGFDFQSMSKEDREKEARRLYKEAGYSDDTPARFELRYNVGEGEQMVALAIQSMWREVLGAEAELVNEEFKVLLSNIQQKEITEVFRLSWIGDYFDPHTFLELMETNSPQNFTGYSRPEFDELMEAAAVEVDVEKRMALLNEAESIMLDDHPVIPIYYYVSKHLVRPEVKGWKETTIDFYPSQFLWLEEDES